MNTSKKDAYAAAIAKRAKYGYSVKESAELLDELLWDYPVKNGALECALIFHGFARRSAAKMARELEKFRPIRDPRYRLPSGDYHFVP